MATVAKALLLPREYLERERRADHRSEFYRGEMFAMSGASWEHSLVKDNLAREAGNQLKETGEMVPPAIPTSDPTADNAPRPRRWIPLSLRMFVAIVAAFAAWAGIRAYRQQIALAEIERLGGSLEKTNRGPDWLRRFLGETRMKGFYIALAIDRSSGIRCRWHLTPADRPPPGRP